jgi:hypothetical protein
LYGSRGVITSKGNVLQEGRIERRAGKTGDRIWNAGTGSFERNIIILFEIDAGMLLRRIVDLAEKLLFVRVNQTGMSSECTYVVGYPVQWTIIAICFLVQSVPEVVFCNEMPCAGMQTAGKKTGEDDTSALVPGMRTRMMSKTIWATILAKCQNVGVCTRVNVGQRA